MNQEFVAAYTWNETSYNDPSRTSLIFKSLTEINLNIEYFPMKTLISSASFFSINNAVGYRVSEFSLVPQLSGVLI